MEEQGNSLSSIQEQVTKLSKCISYSEKYGVMLTEEEIKELIVARKDALARNGRIEFGEGILSKLIFAFCDSPYIYQDNYEETLEALQDIFYQYKNEVMDMLSDDELINFMKEYFDGECQGSTEYLEDTCLEAIARKLREER